MSETGAVQLGGVFTAEELENIRASGDELRARVASVFPEDGSEQPRRSRVAWITEPWLVERIKGVVAEANERFFGFELDGIEPIQYTLYEPGDYYRWHVDKGKDTVHRRKLSLTVQLSKSGEYEGGNLELQPGNAVKTMSRDYGQVVAFPSWILHQVTPVSRGTRRSLVVWAHGPAFV